MRKTLLLAVCTLVFATVAWSDEDPRFRAPGDAVRHQVIRPEVKQLYGTLAALPVRQQRVLIRDLAPAVKAQLWTYNLQLFVVGHPQLTAAQREVIGNVFDLLATPGVFDPLEPGSPAVNLRHTAITMQRQAIDAVFSREESQLIYGRLGPEPQSWTETALGLAPKPLDLCECQTGTDECGTSLTCQGGGPALCTPWLGCGPFGQDFCDGVCM